MSGSTDRQRAVREHPGALDVRRALDRLEAGLDDNGAILLDVYNAGMAEGRRQQQAWDSEKTPVRPLQVPPRGVWPVRR